MSENTVVLPSTERKVDGGKINGGWKCPVFKASGIFSSHMVLQRDEPILVWGFSDAPGSVVKGSFMGYEAEARVDDDNGWRLCFPAQAWTKEPQTMTLTDDRGNGQVFRDVLVGDVWVVGGQSNAELTLSPCVTATEKEIFDENDNFRLFIQTQKYVGEHLDLCAAPQRDVICPEWAWSRPDEDHSRIRANQGHSVDVDVELKELPPPEVLFHGTAERYLESIRKRGLIPGSRLYVHLSDDIETARMVGARHGKPAVLVVRSGQMHRDGHRFYRSANGVWLTKQVPPEYLEER